MKYTPTPHKKAKSLLKAIHRIQLNCYGKVLQETAARTAQLVCKEVLSLEARNIEDVERNNFWIEVANELKKL